MACGDDGADPDPIACTADTGSVEVTVTTGASVRFDWEPACAVALLLVEQQGGDMWLIGTDLPGTLELGDPEGDGPAVSLTYHDRVRAVLGATRLTTPSTGSTEIRAPSSLVLFDEEGKVLWEAPR